MALKDNKKHDDEGVPIPFGEWLPDLPPQLLNGGVITATNVTPAANSYRTFPSLVTFATGVGGRCLGGIIAVDAASNNYNYVGDASRIYSLVETSFTSVTRTTANYATADGEYWEFVNWGNTVIGVNGFNDSVQQISLGGLAFIDMDIGIKARHVTVMKDFVVYGNISDSATNVHRVRWCAINNPFSMTVDAATMADFQDLPSEGGPVQKVLGGEFGVVLQKKSVWRMLFVGSPVVFQFDHVHKEIGLNAPQAAVRFQENTYFLAKDGFYVFDGSGVRGIGAGKVDKFFYADLAVEYLNRVVAYLDVSNKLVMWAYPSNSNVGGNPDKIILYSWAFDRWALVEGVNIQFILQSVTTGTTLDGLDTLYPDLDAITISLDDPQWTGGETIAAAFNTSNQLQRFNGSAMAATIETGEYQLYPDSRAMITEVWPGAHGLSASASVMVINRNTLTESASVGGAQTFPNSTGFCEFRVDSRYFRIRFVTAANTEFTHLIGVSVKGTPTGRR